MNIKKHDSFYSLDLLFDYIRRNLRERSGVPNEEVDLACDQIRRFVKFYSTAEISVRMPRVVRDLDVSYTSIHKSYAVVSNDRPGFVIVPMIYIENRDMGVVKNYQRFYVSGRHNEYHNIYRGFLNYVNTIRFGRIVLNTCNELFKEVHINRRNVVVNEIERIKTKFLEYTEIHKNKRTKTDKNRVKSMMLDLLTNHKVSLDDHRELSSLTKIVTEDYETVTKLLRRIYENRSRLELLDLNDYEDIFNMQTIRSVVHK